MSQVQLPELLPLVSLLEAASSILPSATPSSSTVTHFGFLEAAPLQSGLVSGLDWPIVQSRLEKVFGSRDQIDGESLVVGDLGLRLVTQALQKLQFHSEDEYIQAQMWALAVTKALVNKMNQSTHFGFYGVDGRFHSPLSNGHAMGTSSIENLIAVASTSNGSGYLPNLYLPQPIASSSTVSEVSHNGVDVAPPTASDQVNKPATKKKAKKDPSEPPKKRQRRTSPGPNRPRDVSALPTLPSRSFPPTIAQIPGFHRFYRAFPISSAYPPGSSLRDAAARQGLTVMEAPQGAGWNNVANPFDLYAPRFSKGSRDEKVGLCPICVEPVERGGEGEEKWLNLRNSSYVYHMSFYHGISKSMALPFSPPTDHRTVPVPKTSKSYRTEMLEGHCHHCDKWIQLQSLKSLEAVVPEIFWWKHTKVCHGTSRIAGESDEAQKDSYWLIAIAAVNAVQSMSVGSPPPPPPFPARAAAPLPVGGPAPSPSTSSGGASNPAEAAAGILGDLFVM